MTRVALGTGLTRGRSPVGGCQGLVNCYAEPIKSEGRAKIGIFPFPGKTLFSTLGGGSVRGQIDYGAYHNAVVGTRLWSIDSSGVGTDQGEIEGAARCDLDFNGAQLFIAGDIKSYVYVPSSAALSEVSDPDFLGASSACSVNGYTITTVPSSDEFQWFALRDATSVDALDFATAESNGDRNVAGRVANKDVHLFGEKTVEFFYNSGNPNQAFESKSIPPLEIGCLARDSIVLADTGFLWVGRDGRSGGIGVYRMAGGYTAKKISSPAVDRFLEEYTTPSAIHAFAFQFHAHLFYILHLPGIVSLFYDLATNEWGFVKSGTYPITDDPLGGFDAFTFAVNNGKRIVGASDGNLYTLDGTSNTEAGNPIIREIICSQQTTASRRGAILHELGIDLETGTGATLMAALSPDGGKTWRALTDRSVGATGQYQTNVFWARQGKFQNMIPRFRQSDGAFFAAFAAYADIEPLA